jgi:aspartate/methionine/tyrosine aminotransferase
VPGCAFGAPGFVRSSYAADMATLENAVARLQAWIGDQ